MPSLGSVAWQKTQPLAAPSGPQGRRTGGINEYTLFKSYLLCAPCPPAEPIGPLLVWPDLKEEFGEKIATRSLRTKTPWMNWETKGHREGKQGNERKTLAGGTLLWRVE